MSEFGATHNWLVDGVVVPVLVNGGEVYDAANYHRLSEGRPGVAQVDSNDYHADGSEELVITVDGKVRGTIVPV